MRPVTRPAAALLGAVLLAPVMTPPVMSQDLGQQGAVIQPTMWIQIEARPSQDQGAERAAAWTAAFADVQGYRLSSGWYAVALGPYTPELASARMASLKADRLIPSDSYLTDGREFRATFWPRVDAGAPPSPETDLSQALALELGEPAAEGALPEPVTESPLAPAPETPLLAPQVVDTETMAEARQSEGMLSADERMALQASLQWFGHYQGGIDGAFGPGTRNSMASWQGAMGLEPTGILTTMQRATLLENHAADLAEFGFELIEEHASGISAMLPMGLVEFDRYDPPFVHFKARVGSDLSLALISQPGDQGALKGLYEVLQTLENIPTEGERRLDKDSFMLEGRSASHNAHAEAHVDRGLVKGWVLFSAPGHEARDLRIAEVLSRSFKSLGDTALDPGLVPLDESVKRGLLAGFEVRRPLRSRSGMFVSDKGMVLSSAEGLGQCGKITLDRNIEAKVVAEDTAAGLALLAPQGALAPRQIAHFAALEPRPGAEITVAGYPWEGRLPSPVLTWGTLEALEGLGGESGIYRIEAPTLVGDAGGPVLLGSGEVIGMLMAHGANASRALPETVQFVQGPERISALMAGAGLKLPQAAAESALALPPETLSRRATEMTVLVSCWE